MKKEIIQRMVAAGECPPVDQNIINATKFVIMWARVCAHCKKNEYELPCPDDQQQQGVCCQTCKYGWCCSKEHYDEYKKTGHHNSELCSQFVQANIIGTFCWKHTKQFNEIFAVAPNHQAPSNYDPLFTACPTDWTEYFKVRFPEEYATTQLGMFPQEYLPAATHLLSQPCTCLYAIYHHGLDEYTKGHFASKSMTIHIVGASRQYEIPPRGKIWEELMHCLPAIRSLKTVFIGPEVGVADDGSKRLLCPNMGCCPVCTAQNRTRSIEIFGYTYHEYKQDPMFSQPDLIVAFNTGMFIERTESWKTTLQVMLEMNVPCLFTSYAKQDAIGDYAVIESLNANCLSDEALLNPMRDSTPSIESCPSMSTFHYNMYCTGFKGYK